MARCWDVLRIVPVFITFEGGEGAGKSTQLALVRTWLMALGYRVLVSREPGGTPLGQQLRALLLDPAITMDPLAEVLLFAADRAQHVAQVLKPALAQDEIVLCDRFTDSTLAYQGWGRGLDLAQLRQINQLATGGLRPDLTLWLDIDPEQGILRAGRERAPDRMEADTFAFHGRVRMGFMELAAQEPQRVHRVAAQGTVSEVLAQIQRLLLPYLSKSVKLS